MLGESETTGEGVKALVQSVVGGTFGSVAKITGAADALLSGVAGHREEVGVGGGGWVRAFYSYSH